MKSWSAYPVRFLLGAICEKPETLSMQQKVEAGLVARRLLKFATTQGTHDNWLIRSGIETVCRTYDSDSTASKEILSTLLTRENLEKHGFEYMPAFAREAKELIGVGPEFVRDIYVAAFGFKETSDDQTAMGSGRILPLTSNRRQDYQHSLWQLGETFPVFLSASPEFAIDALIAAIKSSFDNRSTRLSNENQGGGFALLGSTAPITRDGSHIWDAMASYRHDPHLKMLDAFETELINSSTPQTDANRENQLLAAVAKKSDLASIWRRVLSAGIRKPDGIGKSLTELAYAVPILTSLETSDLAGEFIKVVYSGLDSSIREKIERAILSLPTVEPPDRSEAAKLARNRLLGCLAANSICLTETRDRIAELQTQGGIPPNRPPFQIHSSFEGAYNDIQFLADQGVPVGEEPNRRILQAVQTCRDVSQSLSQKNVGLTELESAFPIAKHLHNELELSVQSGAHEKTIENGWLNLIVLSSHLARCNELNCATETGKYIKNWLLKGAMHSSPVFDTEFVEKFDTNPAWSPAPRIEAAEGLLFLAHKPLCIDSTVIETIEKLSLDKVPTVRLQIAGHLGALSATSPETMRKLLSNMLEHDSSSSVVLSLVNCPLRQLFSSDLKYVILHTKIVFARTDLTGKNALEVRMSCVAIFLDSFLWNGDTFSESTIRHFCDNVGDFSDEAAKVVFCLREILVCGTINPTDPKCDLARQRAFSILEAIVLSGQSWYAKLREIHGQEQFSSLSPQQQETAKKIVQLSHSISSQLYFGSGAYEAGKGNNQSGQKGTSIDQKRRFWNESGRLFDLLSINPHPSTVHQMIETLEVLMKIAPRDVFLRIAEIVKSGKDGGYQYESLAVSLIVEVVNRALADHRELLQEDEKVRLAMLAILDIFVEAGWPQAIQLTYRLDEIFR